MHPLRRQTVRKLYAEPMRLIALAALFAPVVFAEGQYLDWQTDYREAVTEAKAAKKPIFLEFRCEA